MHNRFNSFSDADGLTAMERLTLSAADQLGEGGLGADDAAIAAAVNKAKLKAVKKAAKKDKNRLRKKAAAATKKQKKFRQQKNQAQSLIRQRVVQDARDEAAYLDEELTAQQELYDQQTAELEAAQLELDAAAAAQAEWEEIEAEGDDDQYEEIEYVEDETDETDSIIIEGDEDEEYDEEWELFNPGGMNGLGEGMHGFKDIFKKIGPGLLSAIPIVGPIAGGIAQDQINKSDAKKLAKLGLKNLPDYPTSPVPDYPAPKKAKPLFTKQNIGWIAAVAAVVIISMKKR